MTRRTEIALLAAGMAAAVSSIVAWPLWWVSGPIGCACCVIGIVEVRRAERTMVGYVASAFGVAAVVSAMFSALFLTASAGSVGSPTPSRTAVLIP